MILDLSAWEFRILLANFWEEDFGIIWLKDYKPRDLFS